MSKSSQKFLKSPVIKREGPIDKIKLKFQTERLYINKICLKGYKLEKYIAEGGYGLVYQACDTENKCNYAIKIQPLYFNNETRIDDWLREVKLTGILNIEHDIGPKFIGAWLCEEDQVGIIISELWDGQLDNFVCPPKYLIEKLQKQIDIINNLGYVHGDIRPRNILVKKNKENEIIDVTLTDFGTVNTPEQWKQDEKDYGFIKSYYNDHFDMDSESYDYYKDNKITLKDVIKDPFHFDKALIYYFNKYCK
jgi:serine/threonine protein kinase